MKKIIVLGLVIIASFSFTMQKKSKVIFFGDSITELGARPGGYITRVDSMCKLAGKGNEFEFAGAKVVAQLTYLHDGGLRLQLEDRAEVIRFTGTPEVLDVAWGEQRLRAQVHVQGETVHVFAGHGATRIVLVDRLAHAGEGLSESGRLTAPMPGKVVSFSVKAGDRVRKGQALAVMEAMKMEHTIAAPVDGVVQELLYAPGDQVAEGAELLKLSAA